MKNELITVPKEYLNRGGYRRLAITRDEIQKGKCWCCRWSVAFHTWWCENPEDAYCGESNDFAYWKSCYIKDEITCRSYRRGKKLVGAWIGLPPFKNKNIKEGSMPLNYGF